MDRGKPPRHRDYPSCASRTRVGRSGSSFVSGSSSRGRRRKARLLIGSAAAAAILAAVAVLVGVFYARDDGQTSYAGPPDPPDIPVTDPDPDPPPPPRCTPPAQPGAPRPWESSVTVSTYSVANAVNRNLLTTLSIIGWSGVGPDMSMALYHNSASVDSEIDLLRGMGFTLGPGWTTSFSSQIVDDSMGKMVIADDGTQDVYTPDGGDWEAPRGVHDELTFDGEFYWLTHKDQSYHKYDADGLLVAVGDGLGNEITIQRTEGKVETITDAAGRQLVFAYATDGSGRLETITDPKDADEDGPDIADRTWTFQYEYYGDLIAVADPILYEIPIDYDAFGRIRAITDKRDPYLYPPEIDTWSNCCEVHPQPYCDYHLCWHEVCAINSWCCDPEGGWIEDCVELAAEHCGRLCTGGAFHTYQYEYNNVLEYDYDMIRRVTDPLGLVQEFDSSWGEDHSGDTVYTDRRGEDWTYGFYCEGPEESAPNGPVIWSENPLGHRDSYGWDVHRNKILYRDALNHEWTYTYDDRGNMLSATDPLDNVQSWTYDAVNNLTSHTDGEGYRTDLYYELEDYPTLLTKVDEPGTGGESFLAYYLEPYATETCQTLEECKHGLLKQVTDPNGISTAFDYDEWGQQQWYLEGKLASDTDYLYRLYTAVDSGSRTFSVARHGRGPDPGDRMPTPIGDSGAMSYNLNNRMTSGECIAQEKGGACGEATSDPPIPEDFPALPCSDVTPFLPPPFVDFTAAYDAMGRMVAMDTSGAAGNHFTSAYNEVGDMTYRSIDRDEWYATAYVREFTYTREIVDGRYTGKSTRLGPDGTETTTQLDPAGRVEYVDRRVGGSGWALLRADYTYYANGLVETVTYANGAWIAYTYDDAGRVFWIDHRNMNDERMLRLQYQYDARNLVTKIIETWPEGLTIDNTYVYDDRGRLTAESRLFDPPYAYEYQYDQGGNRTLKEDLLTGDVIVYHYDYENTANYGPAGNRLMESAKYEAGNPEPVSTTYYYYNNDANVTRVVTEKTTPDPGEPRYTATWLSYATNGQAVAFVVGEEWTDGCGSDSDYAITYAREFGYDQPRQRYANRLLDVQQLMDHGLIVPASTIWSDYDGHSIYGDYTIALDPTTVTEATVHQPGIGRVDNPHEVPGNQVQRYYHTDHLGTTRWTTGYPGANQGTVYTAFGELMDGPNHRYGYAGTHGYQAHDELPFLHVGWRYYDPGSGRFLQRDPIGIGGGSSVYIYARNAPLAAIDPEGLRLPRPSDHGGPSFEDAKEGVKALLVVTGAIMVTVGTGGTAGPVATAGGGLVAGGTIEKEAEAISNYYTCVAFYAFALWDWMVNITPPPKIPGPSPPPREPMEAPPCMGHVL